MTWNRGIAGPALAIAQSDADALRVMAGPGTGKSFAMQRRVARLLEADGVEPRRILAVTFTRNAAAALVKDLHGLGVDGCDEIRAGTLHAFCFALLSRQEVLQQLGRVARPLITFNSSGVAQFECQPMLHDLRLRGQFGTKRECTARMRAFEGAWARLQHETPGWPMDSVDRAFHRELLDWLRFHGAMLIGELVPMALTFLRANPTASERRAFDHVVVDEYQDLNKAEQVLLDLLGSSAHLAIVGDVDQSIYAFRYAHPLGIEEFDRRHPSTEDVPLAECRRCPRRVVEMASALIRENHAVAAPARLVPRPSNPEGEVHIVQWRTLEEEADGLAAFVEHEVSAGGAVPGDILVLSPRRHIGYAIRDALVARDVPAHSFYQEEALEADEAQRSFTLLNLLVHPEDRVSLRYWLGFGSTSFLSGQYARLRTECDARDLAPRQVLEEVANGLTTVKGIAGLVARYRELRVELEALAALDATALVDRLLPAGQPWAQPMRDVSVACCADETGPAELLGELRAQVTQPEMPSGGDVVRVMSLHKSKGLTSPITVVAGCIEGLIPTVRRDMTPAEAAASLEEQRRLFYVAMTRCRQKLVLSSVARIPVKLAYKMGARVAGRASVGRTIASRFLTELGPTAPQTVVGRHWAANDFT